MTLDEILLGATDPALGPSAQGVAYHCEPCDVLLAGTVPTNVPLHCPICGSVLPQIEAGMLLDALTGGGRSDA